MSWMLIFLTLAWFLVLLSFLVLIHELGHFLAAKFVGVKVEEFGLGYPPRLRRLFEYKGTIFSLNALPFGGFVKLFGDESDNLASDSHTEPEKSTKSISQADRKQMFSHQSIKSRLLVILAGVVVNFVFGVTAFAFIYSKIGIPTLTGQVEIIEVVPESPAQEAGLQVGEVIKQVEINNQQLAPQTAQEFVEFASNYQGENLNLLIQTNEQQKQVSVYVRTSEEIQPGKGAIGIALKDSELRFYPWWQMPWRGMVAGLLEAINFGWLILHAFGQMLSQLFFNGNVPQDLAGPVGIVDQAIEVEIIKQGWLGTLNVAALLSINLAIVNILPIPALDGGRAIFILAEPLLGAARRQRWEQKANTAGFLFLISLIVLVTIKDVISVFR